MTAGPPGGPAHLSWRSDVVCPPPRAATRLPSRRPSGHRTPRATPAAGTGPPRTGQIVAGTTRRRGPPSPAWGPIDWGRHHGSGTRRPDARRSSQTTPELLGADPRGIFHARAWKGPGRTAIPPQSADISNAAWNNHPTRSRTSAGKPTEDGANAPDAGWHTATRPTRSSWPWPVSWWGSWGRLPTRSPCPPRPIASGDGPPHGEGMHLRGFRRALEETPPRSGVTLDRVTRPAGILGPRVRPAPDGRPSGGHEPTALSRITRRMDGLRLVHCPTVKNYTVKNDHEHLKKVAVHS